MHMSKTMNKLEDQTNGSNLDAWNMNGSSNNGGGGGAAAAAASGKSDVGSLFAFGTVDYTTSSSSAGTSVPTSKDSTSPLSTSSSISSLSTDNSNPLRVQIPADVPETAPNMGRRFSISKSLPVSPKHDSKEEEGWDEPFEPSNSGLLFLPKSDSYDEFGIVNGRRDSLGPYPPQFNPSLLFDDDDSSNNNMQSNPAIGGGYGKHFNGMDPNPYISNIRRPPVPSVMDNSNNYHLMDQRFRPEELERDYGYIGGGGSAPNIRFPAGGYPRMSDEIPSRMGPMNPNAMNMHRNHISFNEYNPSWSSPNLAMYNSQNVNDDYDIDINDPWQQYPQPEEAIVGGKTMTVCRYFRQGYCGRGARCKFPHIYGDSDPQSNSISPSHSPIVGTITPPIMNGMDPTRNNILKPNQPPSPVPPVPNSRAARKAHKRSQSEGPKYPPLEMLQGRIYSLCKDQHGCRYLQKKLEEEKESQVEMIFNEAFDHMLELMADPFGNYLCQKLFGYCTQEQKTKITRKVAPGLVRVSLNMHGTRSVQKLIDCLTTDEQISMIIDALKDNVVLLIKDLNGNHVIQKCLHRLTPEQNQFIYDAVTLNCVSVASHRHGCCVLQRCIDHASDAQQVQLATEITYHALTLVQDAFGNYVVQYILDLKSERFTDALIRRFLGHVYKLSFQKFSSNVIEKCIRVAQPDTRRGLIQGLLDKDKLPQMLADQFANYVIQTSLDVAEPYERNVLAEMIRPLLPGIRHLPYCKRIQSRIMKEPGNNLPLAQGGMGPNPVPYGMGHEMMMPHGYGNYLPMPTPTPIQPPPMSPSSPESLAHSMMNMQLNPPLSPVGNRPPNRRRAAT